MKLAEAKLEALVDDLVRYANHRAPCRQALKAVCVTAGQIDEVVLVGGMTRIPKVESKW